MEFPRGALCLCYNEAMRDKQGSFIEQDGPLLARRASEWFEQQGMLLQAIEAAFLAGNTEQTIGLVERFVASSHYKDLREYHMLSRWLKQLPIERLKQSPALCLSYAMTLWCSSSTDEFDWETLTLMKELLRVAEAGFVGEENQPALGEVLALRALTSWRQETLPQAVAVARQALELLPERELLWRSVSEHILGVEALFRGQLRLAYEMFQRTRASAQQLFAQTTTAVPAWTWGKGMFTRTATAFLAWTCFQQGALRQAVEYYQEILRTAYEPGRHSDHVYALLGLGWIAYERNELERATELVYEAELLGKHQPFAGYQVYTVLLQARLQEARGEITAALRLLKDLQARVRGMRGEHAAGQELLKDLRAREAQLLPQLERAIAMARARIHLRRGDLASAQKWAMASAVLNSAELARFQFEQEAMLRARLSLAQGESEQACVDLLALLSEVPHGEQSRNALAIQALLALAESASEREASARRRMRAVLIQAYPEGYQRLFLDEGPSMAQLLQRVAPSLRELPEKAYLQHLLQATSIARTQIPPAQPLEALSPHELRVLRLLATGASAPQIAQQLIVSVATVRTQIQSVYRKLQVNNRVAAIEAARHFQLL